MPQDLTSHRCITLCLPTYGNTYARKFEKDGQELRVRVEGQVVFNGIFQVLNAALDGFGRTLMFRNDKSNRSLSANNLSSRRYL